MITQLPQTDILAPADGLPLHQAPVRSARALWGQGRHLIFAVHGAYTPHASQRQVPGYARLHQEWRAVGLDQVWCLTPNDPFVTQAWFDELGVGQQLAWACDCNAALARALNLVVCLQDWGMGTRPRPYALLVSGGQIVHEAVDAPGQTLVTSAEHMLGVARAYLS